ncbi:MAG: hypothetical protein JNM89_03700 [Hyphomicrobiaceae bacterium]|nr:hypothetical protein [Hyphomicrobiaceae bacterium]
MSWQTRIFRYCERGGDPSFWAEPLNAVSNAAFLIAALAAAVMLARSRPVREAVPEWALVLVLAAIGIGSFLFHTFATRWAAIADVAPIGIFMHLYLAYALRRLLGLPWLLVGAGLGAFVLAMQFADGVDCRTTLLSVTAAARGPCLNGTAGYVPAFGAMLLVGVAALAKGHRSASWLLGAAALFFVSMFFRTVDWEVCELTRVAGRALGTHFLWHLLNAATLYLLMVAAIRHGRPVR